VTTILLSAGDLSGERHAADLVRSLRERLPDARFVGMGGRAMADAGVELHVDQRDLAIGGIFEIFSHLPRVIRAWRGMLRCLRETRPDLVVLVDSGGFNLAFARRVRIRSNAKILYYIAPQVWAWRRGRMKRLAERTDRIAVILPFEPDFYAEHGIEVDFVGHPSVGKTVVLSEASGTSETSEASQGSPRARALARRSLGIDEATPLLGLFPGSRRNELVRHLPIQLDAFRRLREGAVDEEAGGGAGGEASGEGRTKFLRAIVGLAPNLEIDEARRVVEAHAPGLEYAIDLVQAEDGRVLDACDVALAKPGTITVELMLRGKPMVIVGRVNRATAMIARRSLHVAWLSLPNLIAGEEIVPELLQGAAVGDRIAAELAPLFGGEARERQIEALGRARLQLGDAGAAGRTAAIVEEMLGTAAT